MYNPVRFAEKYQLALETALKEKPEGGLCGFELEWNLLDSNLRPLLTVGSGRNQQSFVDFMRSEVLPAWIRERSQLEVFHWMIEWATRPYYALEGAVYEGRLMEGALLNALNQAGRRFGERLYAWHGNLLYLARVDHQSIPGSWQVAKRRYLERCVDLFGESLATAGTHTNLSLPDPLFAWDFMHLTATERGDLHLDDFKSRFYITATRLMRAFASLFIAASASTPMQAAVRDGQQIVILTEYDSVRNLTFPNPEAIDVPDLYRSYEDYLRISYELVRQGIRFGNNNWTPVRARSFAEPVERIIAVTSEQLNDIYARGLYSLGSAISPDEMASQIEKQNLFARINLPMSRTEIRTDDGGHPLDIEIANLTLKHLLLLRFYADGEFARAFRYDAEDIQRARSNETLAARHGLRAEIQNPFTAKPISMREFLKWTLGELKPLGEATGLWEKLLPLQAMAEGAPNTAETLRQSIQKQIGDSDTVPSELLKALAEDRQAVVMQEAGMIAEKFAELNQEAVKFSEFLQRARDEVHADPQVPIRFRPRPDAQIEITYADTTAEVLALAQDLIRIPSVTACPNERLDEVRRAATLVFDYARNRGLAVEYYYQDKYPAVLIGFPGQLYAPVMLNGHFDVVPPDPDDGQFLPYIEGDYLWGRGSADMKTVVATNLVWMRHMLRKGAPFPPINLLLIGNEENGESEAMGTPHLLQHLLLENDYQPNLLIAGERTGEKGDELWGEICVQNRGVIRFDVIGRAQRGHTSLTSAKTDLTERMLVARAGVIGIIGRHLTLSSPDGWESQARFPFIQVGTPGIYNVTADYGVLGVEVRPIPQDDVAGMIDEVKAYCQDQGLELTISVNEAGIICDPHNVYLQTLIQAVSITSGKPPRLGRKLPGTSARFAPAGQGIVWGQSGIGPHAAAERHYIPSIAPYYNALGQYSDLLIHGSTNTVYG
jgi:succinyl-diaminopimelate desuccinylase